MVLTIFVLSSQVHVSHRMCATWQDHYTVVNTHEINRYVCTAGHKRSIKAKGLRDKAGYVVCFSIVVSALGSLKILTEGVL